MLAASLLSFLLPVHGEIAVVVLSAVMQCGTAAVSVLGNS
jgi:hypothetical protein